MIQIVNKISSMTTVISIDVAMDCFCEWKATKKIFVIFARYFCLFFGHSFREKRSGFMAILARLCRAGLLCRRAGWRQQGVLRRGLILGIETSCDDTGAAIIDFQGAIIYSAIVATSVADPEWSIPNEESINYLPFSISYYSPVSRLPLFLPI